MVTLLSMKVADGCCVDLVAKLKKLNTGPRMTRISRMREPLVFTLSCLSLSAKSASSAVSLRLEVEVPTCRSITVDDLSLLLPNADHRWRVRPYVPLLHAVILLTARQQRRVEPFVAFSDDDAIGRAVFHHRGD